MIDPDQKFEDWLNDYDLQSKDSERLGEYLSMFDDLSPTSGRSKKFRKCRKVGR